ncbi:MAG: DMT family transporter [Rhodospirillaceae bacterium]
MRGNTVKLGANLKKSFLTPWHRLSPNLQGAFFVVTGAFLLIVMASLVKFLGRTLPAFEVLFVRFLAGLIVLLPLIWRMGFNKVVPTRKPLLHIARGGFGFLGNLCFFFALIHIPLADTVTIQFSRPLIMILIAVLILREVVGLKRGAVTIIGFSGILMITKPFGDGFDPWAIVAVLGTCFGTGVVLTIKLLSRTEQTVTIMFYFAVVTTTLALIPGILGFTLGSMIPLPASFLWIMPSGTEMILLGLTGALGIIGQGMFTHGVSMGETSFVMPFDYMRIVYAFLIGIAWFSELPGLWSYAGTLVIIGSSLYLLRTEGGDKAKPR